MACKDALETPNIGRRFKEDLNAACEAKSLPTINWGSGLWQDVRRLHQDRKEFVHINATQQTLFQDSGMADRTISTVRDAISVMFHRAGKSPPGWLEDNDDKGWDSGQGSMAHGGVIGAGADPKGDETVRVSYEYKDRWYDDEFYPAGTDHEPLVERLRRNIRIPITAVRVYRGKSMIYERRLQMRGA